MVCAPTQERGNEINILLAAVLGTYQITPTFPRSHAPRGNAYLRDEHFVTSCFGEIT